MSIDQQQRTYRRASRSGSPEGLGAANGRSSKKYRMGDPEGLGGGTKPAGIPKLGGSGYQQFDEGVEDAYVADDFSGINTNQQGAARRAEQQASKTTSADGGLKIMKKSTYPILGYHSQIANTDLARKAKFRVELLLPAANLGAGSVDSMHIADPSIAKFGQHLDMMCESITMPGKTIRSVADDLRYGPKREFAQGVTFAEVGAVFQCTSPYLEKQIFLNWHDMVIDENSWHMNYYNDYIGSLKIYALDRSEQDAFAIQMFEVYPKTVVAQDYGWAQSDAYQTLQVVFTYRNWEQIKWKPFDREMWDIGGAAYMYPEIGKPTETPVSIDAGDLTGVGAAAQAGYYTPTEDAATQAGEFDALAARNYSEDAGDLSGATKHKELQAESPNTAPPGRDYRTKDQYMADTNAAHQTRAEAATQHHVDGDVGGATDRQGAFGGDAVGDANQKRASTQPDSGISPREGGEANHSTGNIGKAHDTYRESDGREGDVVTRPANEVGAAQQQQKSEPLTGGHPGLGPDRVGEASQVASGTVSPTEGTINQGQPTISREEVRENYIAQSHQKGATSQTGMPADLQAAGDDFNEAQQKGATNTSETPVSDVPAHLTINKAHQQQSGLPADLQAAGDDFNEAQRRAAVESVTDFATTGTIAARGAELGFDDMIGARATSVTQATQTGATSAGAADRIDALRGGDAVTQAHQVISKGLPTDIPPREGGRITAGLSQDDRQPLNKTFTTRTPYSGPVVSPRARHPGDPPGRVAKPPVTFPVTFNTMAEMTAAMRVGAGADKGPSTQAPSREGGPEGDGEGRGPGGDRHTGTGRGSSGGGAGMGALTSALSGLGGGGLGSMLGGLTGGGAGIGALMGGLKGGLSGALKGAAVGGIAGAIASNIQAKVHSGRSEALKSSSVSLASVGGQMATATNLFGNMDMAGLQAHADSLAAQGYTSAPDPGGRGAEELGTPASNSVAAAHHTRSTGRAGEEGVSKQARQPSTGSLAGDLAAQKAAISSGPFANIFGSLATVSGTKIQQGSYLASLFSGTTAGGTTTSGVSAATQKGATNQARTYDQLEGNLSEDSIIMRSMTPGTFGGTLAEQANKQSGAGLNRTTNLTRSERHAQETAAMVAGTSTIKREYYGQSQGLPRPVSIANQTPDYMKEPGYESTLGGGFSGMRKKG